MKGKAGERVKSVTFVQSLVGAILGQPYETANTPVFPGFIKDFSYIVRQDGRREPQASSMLSIISLGNLQYVGTSAGNIVIGLWCTGVAASHPPSWLKDCCRRGQSSAVEMIALGAVLIGLAAAK